MKTKYVKLHIDITAESSLCRTCRVENETVSYIVSECKMFVQKGNKKSHENIFRYIH